jgi:magnesium chelatase subunit I
MELIVASVSHVARASSHINQRSGVSVRLSVSNHEILAANAVRRALRVGETVVAPRVSDLGSLAASMSGKVEVESMEDGRESAILQNVVRGAVLESFKACIDVASLPAVVASFEEGLVAHAGDDITSQDYVRLVEQQPALRDVVIRLVGSEAPPAIIASATEFVLEGLHLSKRLNKDESGSRAVYRAR